MGVLHKIKIFYCIFCVQSSVLRKHILNTFLLAKICGFQLSTFRDLSPVFVSYFCQFVVNSVSKEGFGKCRIGYVEKGTRSKL